MGRPGELVGGKYIITAQPSLELLTRAARDIGPNFFWINAILSLFVFF